MNEDLLKDAAPVIGSLLVFGAILKHAIPQFPSRFIPLLTLVGGVVGFALHTGDWSMANLFTGFLVAASATGIHSGIKHVAFGHGDNEENRKGGTGTALLLALTLALPVGLTGAGCASAPKDPAAIAYLSLADTWAGVKAGMRYYTDAYAAGDVSEDDRRKIDATYVRFRLSLLAALDLAGHDWSATTPESLNALTAELLLLLAEFDP